MPPKNEKLLRLRDVKSQTGFKSTWLYGEMAAGRFPAPVKFGYASRWLESAVQAWIAERADPTVSAIHELIDAVNAARNHGVSVEAIQAAIGPISLDHDDGVAHTRAQAERVKGLLS